MMHAKTVMQYMETFRPGGNFAYEKFYFVTDFGTAIACWDFTVSPVERRKFTTEAECATELGANQ